MPAAQPAKPAHTVGLLPVTTLVLWTGCLVVGSLGYALHYTRPQSTSSISSVTAEKLVVELTADPLPATDSLTPPDPLAPPPSAPPLAVAAPSASLAFPLPISGPVRIVEASHAASSRQTSTAISTASAPVQPLVFGRGEGRQPAPAYPSAAIRQGQEGAVTIRFNVGANGRVLSAIASSPSPWPLLDEAALRTVRERWRFAPGAPRTYEVLIRFTLQK
ncbi:MAG: energy transducer TonB [Opitutaceae bacterium]